MSTGTTTVGTVGAGPVTGVGGTELSGTGTDGLAGLDGLVGLEQHAWLGSAEVVAVVPTPTDDLRDDLTPQDVSPGLLGFVVIFAAAVACIPLFWSMVRKLRKVDPRRERGVAGPKDDDGSAGDGDSAGGHGPASDGGPQG